VIFLKPMSAPLLSLIVPTYNESENILDFLQAAQAALGQISHEIIVVDDNSPDETWRIAEEYSHKHPNVRVIRRMTDKGLAPAVLEGFQSAHAEIIGVMDADGQHDEKILPALIQAVQNGAEIAIGSRHIQGGGIPDWAWHRRLSSQAATGLAHLLIGTQVHDPMSGYFLLRKSVHDRIRHQMKPRGYKILLEILSRAAPSAVKEVPYVFRERAKGGSKLTGLVVLDYLRMLWVLKWESLFSPR